MTLQLFQTEAITFFAGTRDVEYGFWFYGFGWGGGGGAKCQETL
jgi:hypothetical protein